VEITILKGYLAERRPVAKPEPLIGFETEPGGTCSVTSRAFGELTKPRVVSGSCMQTAVALHEFIR